MNTSTDETSAVSRIISRMKARCSWLAVVLMALLTIACGFLVIWSLNVWRSAAELVLIRLLHLFVFFTLAFGWIQVLQIWRTSRTPAEVPAMVSGMRRDSDRCYLAFQSLNGGGEFEFCVTEMEMNRFCIGQTGVLRYRNGQYASFTRQDISKGGR